MLIRYVAMQVNKRTINRYVDFKVLNLLLFKIDFGNCVCK